MNETVIRYPRKQRLLYMKNDPACIYDQWPSRFGIHRLGGSFAAMVARKHYTDLGYKALKQYYLVRCPGKREQNEGFAFICRVFGKDKMLKVLQETRHLNGGDPDLFIYREDLSEVFFVEAKAERDKLRPKQLELISIIRQHLCPVIIARILEDGTV